MCRTFQNYEYYTYEPINWKKLYKHYGKKKVEAVSPLQILRWDVIHKIDIPKSLRKLVKITK